LREALAILGVVTAGCEGNPERWSASDLATDLAPLLVERLRSNAEGA
jgi:hypothetical protein